MRRPVFFLATAFYGLLLATAAQALEQKSPGSGTYCERQRQQCVQNCRGEPLCMSHCDQYCGSRLPLSGAATQGTAGASVPEKPQQPDPGSMQRLKAAPSP